ncbi:hypothetical protein [Zavarzinia sp. CC-PAN008]|uniref:hypothetical protein n=1 Tax=Zavarzinia sp. CC-PAN008 TaxID=3243332 RepID=UPI003F74705B
MTRLVPQAGARELLRGCLADPVMASDGVTLRLIAALCIDLEQGGKGLLREDVVAIAGRDTTSVCARLAFAGLAVERASIERD